MQFNTNVPGTGKVSGFNLISPYGALLLSVECVVGVMLQWSNAMGKM